MKLTQMQQTQTPVVGLIITVALLAIVVFSAREVLVGRLSPGEVFQFWTLVTLVINPINRAATYVGDLSKGLIGAARVYEVLDLPIESDRPGGAAGGQRRRNQFRERLLCLRKHGGAGARRAFVRGRARRDRRAGRALGAGQDDDRQPGASLLPGSVRPGRRWTGSTWRRSPWRACAQRSRSCPQEPMLFSTSIADNIRYGKLDATRRRSKRPPARPTPRSSSSICPPATTRRWANGGCGSREASASASRSRGRCCATRASSSWMRRPARWTATPSVSSRRRWTGCCGGERR